MEGLHWNVTVVLTVCPCDGVSNWGAVTCPDEVVDAGAVVAVEALLIAGVEPYDEVVEVEPVVVEVEAVPEVDVAPAVDEVPEIIDVVPVVDV